MAKSRDLSGEVYGKLLVIRDMGHVRYGGRQQLQWLCQCECGNELVLPTMKLPCTPSEIKSAERAGRYLYTSCEACRAKICPICREQFPVSHPSHICPKPECQLALKRDREAAHHRRTTQKYQSDPEFRRDVREYQNDWYAANASDVQARRVAALEALSPEQYAEHLNQVRKTNRKTKARRLQREFLADAQRLSEHIEGNDNG